MVTSEIKLNGEWQVITIDDALHLRGELMRCLACQGRAIPNREYSDGARPHFSHLQGFAYCTRDGSAGSPKHPHPVD
jgi:hypothetical protein